MSTVRIALYPAPDLPGQWIGHCLELDVVSQGNSASHALEMVAEAIELLAQDNVEHGRPALEPRPAPREVYDLLEGAERSDITRILRLPPHSSQSPVELASYVAARAC